MGSGLPLIDVEPAVRASIEWAELDSRARGAKFLAIEPKGVLNSPAVTRMAFWSVNPYIGCEFGCAYCYARDTHRWSVERAAERSDAPETVREAATLASADAFERRILVKVGAAEVLARTLHPSRLNGLPLVIGTATDPYQPAERKFRITRSLLELLRQYHGLRLGIITKSPLITRDTELLAQLSRQHDVTVNCSLASIDGKLLRRLEARSPIPMARLRAMRTLTNAGVRVGLLIAPVLPGINDGRESLRALMLAAKDAGAAWAAASPLRMGVATRRTLLPWLARERPDLARRYTRHFGGTNHVTKAYAAALSARMNELREDVGLVETRRDRMNAEMPDTAQLKLL